MAMKIRSDLPGSFREKIRRLRRDLRARGEHLGFVAPPVYRLAWWMGWSWTPPLFLGFRENALRMGLLFAMPCAIVAGGFPDRSSATLAGTASSALLGGVFFGLSMAGLAHLQQKRLKLPPWSGY